MCEICKKNPCHPRCPNYVPIKSNYYCSICNDRIYEGQKYIENENGEYAHWDCIEYLNDLVDFLGVLIEEMEDFKWKTLLRI